MKLSLFEKLRQRRRDKQNKKSQRKDYLLNEKTPFNITEAFRKLKASLSVSVPKTREGGVAVTVTSSYPEDGKTTVTANLALMFAMSNAKVVLVDADIRKGRVAKFFKKKSSPGLSDYLSGHASLEEILHTAKNDENLSFITCGTRSPKPYELLESEEMTKLIETLKQKFDYVVLDTPPILLVSDALAVAPKTDGTVLVCRHLLSYVSDIQKSVDTLQFAKANVLGLVVNDYHEQSGKKYGGYSSYYRYSQYAYGYGDDEPDGEENGGENAQEREASE
ncbi:MAG: CpsD/CapB family tyrosine-protein kinase [Clostridia bacterium]|nr:CpsD/CapB family tyrosine-protein kinase [Clostridia bacterium]